MSALHFYTRALPRCQECPKPASVEVCGTGNVVYGYFCAGHGTKKVKSLTAFWNAQDAEEQKRQLANQ
jgi:hypothetical protein